ncbi:MAG: phytanoyl-CoA dioxygenase family protein [Gammaproteobacteria bacterium]|nr:phytanoyl-CoA dioxygenase family protein [Gammaproteobacteria bacterium]
MKTQTVAAALPAHVEAQLPQAARDFSAHGVAVLRQAFDAEWISRLRAGVEKNIAAPTARGRVWNRDAAGRVCFYDSQAWRDIDEYRAFVERSPAAQIAAQLLDTAHVNFFFDAIFVRSRGAQFRTPFHQDEPYWSVEGFDTCSIWMPLVAVEKRSALEFVRGSHRWRRRFKQTNFGALTGDARDQRREDADDGGEEFPDIENHRADYPLVSWALAAGDCVAFNGRTIHGGSGNLAPDRDLQVFNTQWLGDDVRVCFREQGMDPDHSPVMRALGLKPGQRLRGAWYPAFRF